MNASHRLSTRVAAALGVLLILAFAAPAARAQSQVELKTAMGMSDTLNNPAPASIISLAGAWQFRMGAPRLGATQQALPAQEFSDTINLPGTTDTNNKGPENTRREAQTLTRLHFFEGTAWYQRELTIPPAWSGKRVTLFLDRTKYSQLWLDGKPAGVNPILGTPQEYALGTLTPGKHTLTLAVDNTRKPVNVEAHQWSNNTQGNWNGVIGRIELRATDMVYFDDVQVYPNVAKKSVRVKVALGNAGSKPGKGFLMVSVEGPGVSAPPPAPGAELSWTATGGAAEVEVPLGNGAQTWDEFHPVLYNLTATFKGDGFNDTRRVSFGLREFKAQGTQFAVNGRTTFLRGKHDGCVFPLTGHPPMDVEGWTKYLQTLKDYGINHVRCHTWIPPEAAYAAADRLGIYIQPELPYWGAYNANSERALMPEAERVMKMYGNHPSFVMFSLGNELGGDAGARAIMARMMTTLRALDPRHLYCEGSNNFLGTQPLAEKADYWTTVRIRDAKGQLQNVRASFATVDGGNGVVQTGPANTLHDYAAAIAGVPLPVIGHEVAQFTVYPNFKEIAKYTGVFRARNMEIFRDKLAAAGMIDQADDFFQASGRLCALCYREDIEAALRTPGFGGFQLLDLQDFPGQGTALVGILDAFMDSKGLITPAEWRQFCAPIVILPRFEKYTWTAGETFTAQVDVAHYGEKDLTQAALEWKMKDETGKAVASGTLPATDIKQGGLRRVGQISTALPSLDKSARITLELSLLGTQVRTTYPIWVYKGVPTVTGLNENATMSYILTRSLDALTLKKLADGSRVLLVLDSKRPIANTVGGGFATDFWCWPMFKNKPGTMGLLMDPKHPALSGFPTESYSNWQWFKIASNAQPVILDKLPKELKPIVQVIDNLDRVHRLGLVWEAKVGPGRLLVCASDLSAQDSPEAGFLLASLSAYANSDRFNPTVEISEADLRALLESAQTLPGKATASTTERDTTSPDLAIDGKDDTRWCASSIDVPQWWRIDFEKPHDLSGAQIHWENDTSGYRYILEGSTDGANWTTLSDQRRNRLSGTHDLKFQAKGVRAVRISISALPTGNNWASIREVRFFAAE